MKFTLKVTNFLWKGSGQPTIPDVCDGVHCVGCFSVSRTTSLSIEESSLALVLPLVVLLSL